MDVIDLYNVTSKEEAVKVCQKHNITVKEAVINNLDIMVNSIAAIKDSISSGKRLENEDWVKAAAPLNVMMNVLMNHWYLED